MARPSEGPRCPTPEEIGDLIDFVTNFKDIPSADVAAINVKLDRVVEVLDWAGEQVNKRRHYSKKFQLKDKERTRLLKEKLGEQYDDIITQAKHDAEKRIFEEVASGQPDSDDVEFANTSNDTNEE